MRGAELLAGLGGAVAPGSGLVVRHRCVVAVVGADVPVAVLERILGELSAHGPDPDGGRSLIRRLHGVLTDLDEAPRLAVAAAAGDGVALLASGPAVIRVGGEGGVVIDGRDALVAADRLVPADFAVLELGDPPVGTGPAAHLLDLRDGVVPGAGIRLAARTGAPAPAPAPAPPQAAAEPVGPSAAPAAPGEEAAPPPRRAEPLRVDVGEPPATPSAGGDTPAPTTAGAPSVPEAAPPGAPGRRPTSRRLPPPGDAPAEPFEAVALVGASPGEAPSRAPLPVEGADGDGGAPVEGTTEAEGVDLVEGRLCVRDHFNHPHAAICAWCGISMAQESYALVRRPRPPLGVLVVDDTSTFTLDADYVIGRQPDTDPAVAEGRARPLVIEDPDRIAGRRHAEIRLRGWDVILVDRGSANGTWILPPGADSWIRLEPDREVVLASATRIQVGPSQLVYHSHHVR